MGSRRQAGQSPRVAVRIRAGQYYNDRLLIGIARFGGAHERWRFIGDPVHADQTPEGLEGLGLDGLLVYSAGQKLTERYRALGVPFVNTTARPVQGPCARARTDAELIGRYAAENLLGLGLKRMICVVRNKLPIDLERADHFDASCIQNKTEPSTRVSVNTDGIPDPASLGSIFEQIDSDTEPIGVWCATDDIASALVTRLTAAGIPVPQRVAVLGCGNDELTCTFSNPRISSVDTDAVTVGYRAAELLDQMMSGEVKGTPVVTVPPVGVVERESTRMIAADDPHLAEAVRIVRNRACDGIRVSDVLAQVPLSRKSLERGFKQVVGRTPLQEIKRLQLQEAKQQLAQTERSVDQIARRIGLRDGRYLSQVLRQAEGVTPTEYRQKHRRPTDLDV